MVARMIAVWLIGTLSVQAAGYIIAIKGNDPAGIELAASAPPGTVVIDYAVWRDVPAEYKQYNPAQYPTVINTSSGAQAQQPGTWTNAIAILAQQRLSGLTDAERGVLVLAENALIGLLTRTGFLEPGATSIPAGTTQTVEQYMIRAAMTNESAEVANFIARFHGLKGIIESYGQDTENATWHEEDSE